MVDKKNLISFSLCFLFLKVPFYYGKRPADACVAVNVGSTISEVTQSATGCERTTLIEVELYKPEGNRQTET